MKHSPLLALLFLVLGSHLANAVTVGYWRFEEGTAGGGASGAGSIIDSSGNGNHGTAFGSPTYSSDVPYAPLPGSGTPNTLSLDFDGFNDQVIIGHSASLNLNTAFTVEFSMRSDATPVGQDLLVDKSHGGTGGANGWLFQTLPSNGILQFGVGTGTGYALISSLSNLYDGNWHDIVGTYDGDTLSYYVDREFQGSLSGITYAGNTRDIRIGNHYQFTRFFPGEIDELRISDLALAPSQFLIPEPSRALLLLVGLAATAIRRRR